MDIQFYLLIEGVLEYEQKKQTICCILLTVLIVTMCVLAFAQFKRVTLFDKLIICTIILFLVAVLLVFLFVSNSYQTALKADMDTLDFVIYSGKYTHDNYEKDSFYHNIYIFDDDEKQEILRYPDYGNQYCLHADSRLMPIGSFEGTIVYTKRSKIIVAWSIEDNALMN